MLKISENHLARYIPTKARPIGKFPIMLWICRNSPYGITAEAPRGRAGRTFIRLLLTIFIITTITVQQATCKTAAQAFLISRQKFMRKQTGRTKRCRLLTGREYSLSLKIVFLSGWRNFTIPETFLHMWGVRFG